MHESEETIPLKKKKGSASFQNTPLIIKLTYSLLTKNLIYRNNFMITNQDSEPS